MDHLRELFEKARQLVLNQLYGPSEHRMVLAIGIVMVLMAGCAKHPQATLVGYLGGSGGDDCDGITVDTAGAVFLACHSDSPDFPGLRPDHPRVRSSQAVIVKIDSRTGRLLWTTHTRGTSFDAAIRVHLGQDGSVYVALSTLVE